MNGAQSSAPRWITPPVVRDEAGTFQVIATKRITNLETLETMVCREDLCLANSLYLRKVKMATYYANIVRALKEAAISFEKSRQ